MKNLLLLSLLFAIGCTPKVKVIATESAPNSKHNFQKVETVYYFLENDQWIVGEPDEIPEKEANLDFTLAMYKNIVYPAMARENGVQGTVILALMINEVGQVIESEIKQDLREGCGAAALKAVRFAATRATLPAIYKDGMPRKVKIDMPVRFKFE